MILLLAACGPIEVTKTCSETEVTVASETMLDLGFTPAQLAETMNLRSLTMYDLGGEAHEVDVGVGVTEGAILLTDKTIDKEVTGGAGPNRSITVEFTDGCTDELTVPVAIKLTDVDIDLTAIGTLYTSDDGNMGTGTKLEGTFDPAASTFPPGFHTGPSAGVLRGWRVAGGEPTLAVWVTAADGVEEAVLSTEGLI